jgi:SagB-type dehydrogenase family enzyme
MMKLAWALSTLICIFIVAGCQSSPEPDTLPGPEQEVTQKVMKTVSLPAPRYDSDISLEQSLMRRRSVRSYTGEPLALTEVSQLLWAAQGITDEAGLRTAPSAGGLYPLEVYLVSVDVANLDPGIYHYNPEAHELEQLVQGDMRDELADASLSQSCVREGAASLIITAVYERTTGKYGERGIRYVYIEAGHAAQNVCLQATAMGLGLVTVGAFDDEQITGLLGLPADESPLYVIPFGRK